MVEGGGVAAVPSGTISGTVQQGGTPVEGAVVFVNHYRSGAAAGRATTDSNGNYTIGGLSTGSYRIQVNATPLGFPLQYYDGALSARAATAVSVVDGQNTPNIDFTLGSGGSIAGTVTASGGVVSGAEVFVQGRLGGVANTTTAANGTYTISGLADDDYLVQVDASGQGYLRQHYDNAASSAQATLVTVSSGAVTGINFAIGTGGTITGFVLQSGSNTPVMGAAVRVRGCSTRRLVALATTDASGEYAITGLAAGTYRVEVDAIDQGFSLLFYNNTPESSKANAVSVGPYLGS